MLLCAQRTASYHAAAPFFVRPCRLCLDSSPIPLVLLPPSRRKRERRRRNKRLEEVVKKEPGGKGGSESRKKWKEREVPMNRPRRSFCFSPLEISASFPVLLLPLLSSPFRLLESRLLFLFFFFLFLAPSLFLARFDLYSTSNSFAPYTRGGGCAMTSLADFRLECSHLESVFSCTEPVDIFSRQTSGFSEFSTVFRRTSPFLSLENVFRN